MTRWDAQAVALRGQCPEWRLKFADKKDSCGKLDGDVAKSSSPMAADLTVRRRKPLLSPKQAILRQAASQTASKPEKEYCER